MMFISPSFAKEYTHHHNHHQHHRYAPIGVMGDHPHQKGEWMVSYRFSEMQMAGNKKGTKNISKDVILNDFMVAPLTMTMKMHMFGLMRGINDKLTIMAMLPYKELTMDHQNNMGIRFATKSNGIGDIKLSGLYSLYNNNNTRFLFNAGISIPSGSINKKDDTPSNNHQKLPYPMQLGSGTYNFLPKFTYSDFKNSWSWGGQLGAVIHLGQNDNHYSFGDKYNLTIWQGYKINNKLTSSIRLNGKIWENIDGLDPELNVMMSPAARSDLRSGKEVELLFGINFVPNNKYNVILSLEAGGPIYQKLDGPQLKNDYLFTIGSQITF